ncbi:Uncharacterized protein QTN25_006732 [Entamoeba marina]
MMLPFFALLLSVIAIQYEVQYAISTEFPNDWNVRGIISCEDFKCTLINSNDLIFKTTKETDLYYLKVGDVFTSIPVSYVSNIMKDFIELDVNNQTVIGIHYEVQNKQTKSLTTSVEIVKSIALPKVQAEKRPPAKDEEKDSLQNTFDCIIILYLTHSGCGY